MEFLGAAVVFRWFCFGDLRIGSLLFADDAVLLASSVRDLQFSLHQFVAETARMRINTSESQALVLSQKKLRFL